MIPRIDHKPAVRLCGPAEVMMVVGLVLCCWSAVEQKQALQTSWTLFRDARWETALYDAAGFSWIHNVENEHNLMKRTCSCSIMIPGGQQSHQPHQWGPVASFQALKTKFHRKDHLHGDEGFSCCSIRSLKVKVSLHHDGAASFLCSVMKEEPARQLMLQSRWLTWAGSWRAGFSA